MSVSVSVSAKRVRARVRATTRARACLAGLAGVATALALAVPTSGAAMASTGAHSSRAATSARAATLTVGSVTLHRCDIVDGAWCGSIERDWDSNQPGLGTLSVGFAYLPAADQSKPAVGTVVPREGGPGYSTTGTGVDYAAMYGPLLDRRNLLLVDQRGTGLTAPVKCPSLQQLSGAYAPAAGLCSDKLGARANLYGTAQSADDLSAVITALGLGKVDLYGDSYGTFFAQVFLGRHDDQVRSVVLDSAYPAYGEDAWYGTQGAALRSSLDKVCARTPSCAARPGSSVGRLTRLLDLVRAKPLHAKVSGGDGKRHKVTVDGAALVFVAYGATFGAAAYTEFDAAVRAALGGDPKPIARLYAEDEFAGATGPAAAYSEGLDAAVSCRDYPQLYDMSATPAVRQQQYADAVAAKEASDPGLYGPFTIKEYLGSDWEEQDWCTEWAAQDPLRPDGPIEPPSGHYAAVPTLILSGELDTITTPAEGAIVASQIPGARQVIVANSFHVTAVDDTDGCGQQLVRAFVRYPTASLPKAALACARSVPPLRGTTAYRKLFRHNGTGSLRHRAARTAALTASDVMDRWLQSVSGDGPGLRGGSWTSNDGYFHVKLTLSHYRLARDLRVSGTVDWRRKKHHATVDLTITRVDSAGHAVRSRVNGTVTGHWNTRARGAHVRLVSHLGGKRVVSTFLAP